MTRSLRQRIQQLEGEHVRPGTPDVIVATCPIPGSEQSPTAETVQQWLKDGLAHIAFRGHAVLYDGGRRHPLTVEEWQARYCPMDGSLH
ncbi:hypothetical protein ACVWWO_005633 [Bradyrhizobium sp. F1.13.1]